MKIRVEAKDGTKETITLVPPIREIYDGERLSCISSGDGTDHWFTPDGYYDGWGGLSRGSLEDAHRISMQRNIERRKP